MKIHSSQLTIGSPNIPWPPRACMESVFVGALTEAAAGADCCTTGSAGGG